MADGPYFEDALPYCETAGDDRELTNYVSVGWLKTMAAAPGSPIVVLTFEEHQALLAQIDDLTRQVADLDAKVSSATTPEVVVSPVDTDALVVELSKHFAKKTGPRPKAAA